MIDLHYEASIALHDLYEDKDGERKMELSNMLGPDEFTEFYARLEEIQDFYQQRPNEVYVPLDVQLDETMKPYYVTDADQQLLPIEFSDEECFGRTLDLHDCYNSYLNLRNIEKCDYVTYLTTFDHVFDIAKERKNTDYMRYLETLIVYLNGFVARARPLLDLDDEMERVHANFDRHWQRGQFPGWPKDHESAMVHDGAHLDLSAFSSAEELASLGLDRLKSALMALGIRCGGTLEERAHRLFSTKGKADLDPLLLATKRKSR